MSSTIGHVLHAWRARPPLAPLVSATDESVRPRSQSQPHQVLFPIFWLPLAETGSHEFAVRRFAVDSSAHPRQSGLGWRSYGATSEDLKLIPILGSRPS